jgi:iron complex outermembrane receptor protein
MAFFSPIFSSHSRRSNRLAFRATQVASAIALLTATGLSAQSLTDITITDTAPSQVSGFGDVPLRQAPFSATTIDRQTLQDIGAQRVSDALRLDASVADSYNSPAYWDSLSVRGYTLDNRYNYRREGLPISAETMIGMDNKERIELFKGTSGIQAGTSAPGGLVNYVVKRPPSAQNTTVRDVSASFGPGHSSSIALDLGGRFGQDQALGYRLNAAYEDLNPYIKNSEGHRRLLALAMDWRLTPDSRLEWEIERSERQQMGVNAYSLLGSELPPPVDGKRNLTRQDWSVPAVFRSNVGSLRFKQSLADGWLWTTQWGSQRLKTDDRLSFGYGCGTSDYTRFCQDGSFALYDFRSENEHRLSDALQTSLSGQAQWGATTHHFSVTLLRHKQLDRMPVNQAFALLPTPGQVNAPFTSQPNPDFSGFNTQRSEHSTELAVQDRMTLAKDLSVWAGLRHVVLDRASERTELANPNAKRFKNQATTPWLALSKTVADWTGYISYGEGLEQFSVPNSTGTYWVNAGELLGVGKSRQTEIGLKSPATKMGTQGHVTLFKIVRPLAYDDGNGSRLLEGQQTHQGVQWGGSWTDRQWLLDAQAQWLHARINGVTTLTALNGQIPVNVPALTVRAMAQYRFAGIPGLRSSLRVNHEGTRRVTEDSALLLPAWTTLDLATHYDTRIQGTRTQWTLAIDNLADRRYWRESPKQYGHYYLYPGAPRTLRLAVKASF